MELFEIIEKFVSRKALGERWGLTKQAMSYMARKDRIPPDYISDLCSLLTGETDIEGNQYNLKPSRLNPCFKDCMYIGKPAKDKSCLIRNHKIETQTENILIKQVWGGMHQRCYNKKSPAYKDYGGRGVLVSDEWFDFNVFKNDMGPRPSNKHQIDRVDNDGSYSKENCRWVTRLENSRNRRTSIIWVIEGNVYYTSLDASKGEGVPVSRIRQWCQGYTYKGKKYDQKPGCFCYKLYK